MDDNYKVNTLSFDNYGQYLAIGGTDLRVVKAKDGSPIVTFANEKAQITGVHWRPLAHGLMSSSLDRSIRIYGN